MNAMLPRARLYLIAGAALMFLGGLLVAVGRWNLAETDRAFVASAALAARGPPPGGVRYWAPNAGGQPDPGRRAVLEAADRLRQAPTLAPFPAIQAPVLPSRPPILPRSAPVPTSKPEAVTK